MATCLQSSHVTALYRISNAGNDAFCEMNGARALEERTKAVLSRSSSAIEVLTAEGPFPPWYTPKRAYTG